MSAVSNIPARFGHVLLWTASAGVLIWIAWSLYSMVLWRNTPASPDRSHFMAWTEHADTHYLTTAQHSLYSHFQLAAMIGLTGFFVLGIAGGLILRTYAARR